MTLAEGEIFQYLDLFVKFYSFILCMASYRITCVNMGQFERNPLLRLCLGPP